MRKADGLSYLYHRDEILLLAEENDLIVDSYKPYPEYKGLETLIIYNQAFKNSNTGLVHISGTHGVEGLIGGGIQISILQDYAAEISTSQVGVLLVFALNPFGFHFKRRTGIENIDLNRNCGDGIPFPKKTLAHIFTKTFTKAVTKSQALRSAPIVILGILLLGFRRMVNAIAEGQTTNPKGIIYTGQNTAVEVQHFLRNMEPLFQNKIELTVLDAHSGLGKVREELLFLMKESTAFNKMSFANQLVDPGSSADNYRGTGYVADRLALKFPQIKFNYILQEFGVQSLMTSFLNLVQENYYHFEFFNRLSEKEYLQSPIKKNFIAAYFPEDIENQKWIFKKGAERFLEIFQHLKN